MSMKNLALDVESIALALSEEGGYEYYHIDDDLKELAKNVSDMQVENAKLRELVRSMYDVLDVTIDWSELDDDMRELGVEVDA